MLLLRTHNYQYLSQFYLLSTVLKRFLKIDREMAEDDYELTIVSYEKDNKEQKLIGIPLSSVEIVRYVQDVEKVKANPSKFLYILIDK